MLLKGQETGLENYKPIKDSFPLLLNKDLTAMHYDECILLT